MRLLACSSKQPRCAQFFLFFVGIRAAIFLCACGSNELSAIFFVLVHRRANRCRCTPVFLTSFPPLPSPVPRPKLRAYLYRGLLTPYETDHIIDVAKRSLARSGVVNSDTGGSLESEIRTSSGTFLGRKQDSIVAAGRRFPPLTPRH